MAASRRRIAPQSETSSWFGIATPPEASFSGDDFVGGIRRSDLALLSGAGVVSGDSRAMLGKGEGVLLVDLAATSPYQSTSSLGTSTSHRRTARARGPGRRPDWRSGFVGCNPIATDHHRPSDSHS